jgi:hypothetical protein
LPVARGEETRPGTAAECCIALSDTSLKVPLNTSAAGLYARMWLLAGLPPVELSNASAHYEAHEGSLIDDHEADCAKRGLASSPAAPTLAGPTSTTHGQRRATAPAQLTRPLV